MTYKEVAEWYLNANNTEKIEFLNLIAGKECYWVSNNTVYLHPIKNEDPCDFWDKYRELIKEENNSEN